MSGEIDIDIECPAPDDPAPSGSYVWRDGRKVPLDEAFPVGKPDDIKAEPVAPPPAPRPRPTNPQEALLFELKSYGAALLPGAAEIIAQRSAGLTHLSDEKRAEKIATLLESPLWAAFRNPEFAPGRLENGQPVSPLRAALIRHSADLRPGEVDALVQKLAPQTIGKSPAQVAGLVVKWLGSREARDHLVDPAPLPEHENRISGMAQHHFRDLVSPAAADRLAAERAHEWRNLSERYVVAAIAKLLQSGLAASHYGAKPLPKGDPRLQPNRELSIDRPRYGPQPAKAEPVRDAGGKFQPASPVRKPSSGF
jgi:hypothetical protein